MFSSSMEKWLLLLSLSLFFCIPAFYNGSALLFPDTIAYRATYFILCSILMVSTINCQLGKTFKATNGENFYLFSRLCDYSLGQHAVKTEKIKLPYTYKRYLIKSIEQSFVQLFNLDIQPTSNITADSVYRQTQ